MSAARRTCAIARELLFRSSITGHRAY
jgi:hypothetical protein